MNIITVTDTRAIQLDDYAALPMQQDLVDLAVQSYGYLLVSQPPREYKLCGFADVIESNYDTKENSRNRYIVETLRLVQAQTERLFATIH